jgi:hypothetical protein
VNFKKHCPSLPIAILLSFVLLGLGLTRFELEFSKFQSAHQAAWVANVGVLSIDLLKPESANPLVSLSGSESAGSSLGLPDHAGLCAPRAGFGRSWSGNHASVGHLRPGPRLLGDHLASRAPPAAHL